MPVGRSQMRKTEKTRTSLETRNGLRRAFRKRARCQLCFSRSARCAAEKRAHHLGTPDARRNAVEARRTIIPRGTKDPRLAVTSAQLGRDAVPGRARVSHAGRPRDFRSFARRHRCYHLSWVASAPSVDRSAREEVRACAETRARALCHDARERSNGRSRAETRSPPVRFRAGWDAAASPLASASTDIRRDAADARVRGAGRASGARVRDAGGAAGRHRLRHQRASSESGTARAADHDARGAVAPPPRRTRRLTPRRRRRRRRLRRPPLRRSPRRCRPSRRCRPRR